MDSMMKVIAEYAGWQVVLDANSVVSIHFGKGQWVCDYGSTYEAIVGEVKDPEIRRALLGQWKRYIDERPR